MNNVPFWSKYMERLNLHDACWIMGNCETIKEIVNRSPYYSLLPIRFYNYGSWNYREDYDIHSVGCFRNGFELVRISDICSSKAHFAQKLWEKAAEETRKRYPEIEALSFGAQSADGIYPIQFRYDIQELTEAQRQIMKDIIDDGFTVDEYMDIKHYEKERRKIWKYEGVVKYTRDEMREIILGTPHGKMPSIELRKRVSFSYEECEEYYKCFDERMLLLGNQIRAYNYYLPQNTPLFEAAKQGNKERIKELIADGYSLNEISPSGETAFSLLLDAITEKSKMADDDRAFLDYIIEHGVNVNLIGVTAVAEPPVFNAFVFRNDDLYKWLLDHGADTNVQIFYDLWDGYDSYTADEWINEHMNISED